jgi:Zn-dependent peptidase ImmA (M78 family)
MPKLLSESITESRLLYQNPYAYLNDAGGYSALPLSDMSTRESNPITMSREIFQDPYAHLDGTGNFSALPNFPLIQVGAPSKDPYPQTEIEQRARHLQMKLWKNRSLIWPNSTSHKPTDVLDPFVALNAIGYDYELVESLGQFYSGGKLTEVAGTIDNRAKKVRISRQFSPDIRSFTAAHELGHALLHETSGLHRDRALDGSLISRDAIEFEADKFAAFFLMPQKQVKFSFNKIFLTDKFFLNEETAFALGISDYEEVKNKCKTLRQLSKTLASAKHYNGLQFTSLAKQFRVSTEAMAIRLEELELLEM